MDNQILNYAPLVRAMARRYQGPGMEREDLEQEGWLALVEARRCYRPELGPRPAFYKSRVRGALAKMLRRYRRDALFGRAAEVEFSGQDDVPGFELRDLFANLSKRQSQVLLLYYHQGLSLREAAKCMGISISAAHTHKKRGLKALAGQMSL